MLKVLLVMFAGMGLGYLSNKKPKLIKVNNKSIIWIIFALLFFMGVSVGANDEIMNNLDTIGWRGVQLSLVAVLGSVLLSWVVYKLFFKNGASQAISKQK